MCSHSASHLFFIVHRSRGLGERSGGLMCRNRKVDDIERNDVEN